VQLIHISDCMLNLDGLLAGPGFWLNKLLQMCMYAL